MIFGAGVWGREFYKAMKKLPLKYYIDNDPKQDRYEGLAVVPYQEFVGNYQGELICILSKYYKDMYSQLLHDGVSRDRILNIGEFLYETASRQYFDLEGLKYGAEREIFVDGGCFDGMTSVSFKQWCQKDAFVYVFEPDRTCREKCMENLEKNHVPYQFIAKGLWSEETKLQFRHSEKGSSRIEEQGTEIVEVVPLDSILEQKKVTFIKMDLEGSEYQALLGAERMIRENKPKLAVCVYHKPEDILQIPEIILKFYPGYRLYLRHYAVSKNETVLYALP